MILAPGGFFRKTSRLIVFSTRVALPVWKGAFRIFVSYYILVVLKAVIGWLGSLTTIIKKATILSLSSPKPTLYTGTLFYQDAIVSRESSGKNLLTSQTFWYFGAILPLLTSMNDFCRDEQNQAQDFFDIPESSLKDISFKMKALNCKRCLCRFLKNILKVYTHAKEDF